MNLLELDNLLNNLIKYSKKNLDTMVINPAIRFGRSRWKIENQDFNNQKTKKYNIEHDNSLNYNAMKKVLII